MVNVTKINFIEQSNDFLHHLPEADFVALDEEMTGISMVNSGRPRKDLSPSDRYAELKQVPERYSIIQLGFALHKGRQVRKYSFFMFPNEATTASSEIVLNPSTVKFLHKHGMSFDTWSKYGVSFCTERQAEEVTQKYLKTEQEVAAATDPSSSSSRNANSACTVQETLTRRIELRRSEDIDFFARTMASLREWLDGVSTPTPVDATTDTTTNNNNIPVEANNGNNNQLHHHHLNNNNNYNNSANNNGHHQFLLPPCNSFLRRALSENIAKEYPSLILEVVGPNDPAWIAGSSNNLLQIRVLRLTTTELRERHQRLKRQRWTQYIVEKVGMWRIIQALRQVCNGQFLDRTHPLFAASADQVDIDLHCNNNDNVALSQSRRQRPIPLVVHNGWMDLMFLMTHFDDNARPTLPDALGDFKRLIRSYFPIIFDTKVLSNEYCGYDDMNLAQLYGAAGDKGLEVVSSSKTTTTTTMDGAAGSEHEASYDAYMTGAIFIGLSRHLKPIEHEQTEETEEGEVLAADDNDEEMRRGARQRQVHWFESSLGRNRIYHIGLFTLDLENPDSDPLSNGLLPECAYRVTDIDPTVTTRDIVWCLNNLVDADERPVNFDIVWVDDTTFIVATRYRPSSAFTIGTLVANPSPPSIAASASSSFPGRDAPDEGVAFILKSHGELIHRALSVRFGKAVITTLEQHFRKVREATEAAKRKHGWFSRFFELTHLGALKRMLVNDNNSEDDRRAKRAREN